jgi:hypothetical protein
MLSARIKRAVLTSPARDWSEWPTMQTKDNNFVYKTTKIESF